MGIDVKWEDERGHTIETIGDAQGHFSRVVQTADLGQTMCLRFLDPWGDTTFNQAHIPVLIDELQRVVGAQASSEVRDHLNQILALATRARGRVHTYLKFIGD